MVADAVLLAGLAPKICTHGLRFQFSQGLSLGGNGVFLSVKECLGWRIIVSVVNVQPTYIP